MSWTLLIALLVKSSIVAGAGLACARFLGLRAVERVDVLRATVCILLGLPVVTALLPDIDLALLPPLAVEPPVAIAASGELAAGEAATSSWSWPPSGETLGALWLFGVVLVAGRLMLGLRTLTRWTRQGAPVTCEAWLAPIEDLPQVDRPKLVASDRVDGPLSWGVSPGSILIDPATLADRRSAPAIMAHELAHLRRHDWLFLVLSRLALAMFWFNPLVWRLHAVLVERSEEAADAAALRFVDRAHYARTLVRLASNPIPHRVPGLATAMAADARTLKTRIACIMTDTSDRRRPLTLAATVVALAAVATPLAALGISRQDAPPAAPVAPAVPAAPMAKAVQPAQPVQPAAPSATASSVTRKHTVTTTRTEGGYTYTTTREATPEEIAAADEARAQAAEARVMAAEARREAEEARREARRVVEAHREEIQAARRIAVEARKQGDWSRVAAEHAREAGERAREAGERAREMGERARVEAQRHMVQARVHMAQGAVQMRKGAQDMRDEAIRLRDPAYRARQIEENRQRGHVVTDEQLRDLSQSLPAKADELERKAGELAERARES